MSLRSVKRKEETKTTRAQEQAEEATERTRPYDLSEFTLEKLAAGAVLPNIRVENGK